MARRTVDLDGELFGRIRPLLRRDGAFLLESGGPRDPIARWSAAGLVGRTARLVDDRLVVLEDGDRRVLPGDPLDALGRLVPDPTGEGPLVRPGDWVGLVGYEALRLVEDVPTGDAPTPDLWLGEVRSVVCRDRTTGRATLVAAGPDAEEGVRELAQILASGPATGDPVQRVRPQSTHDRGAYEEAVRRVQRYVRQGDVFQANIAQTFDAPAPGEPVDVYGRLRRTNPGPFNAYLDLGDVQVASSSPERLVRLGPDRIEARPIAGTRPRGDGGDDDRLARELREDPKETAEHAMIVDLYRNDVARVAEPGSVHVDPYRRLERYARVQHLTSNVVGRPRDEVGPADALRATFPGGSITGAPKVRAMEVIAEVEPGPRGPYTGSLGVFGRRVTDLNILIRSLVFRDGRVSLAAGGGVVHGSDPAAEYRESLAKAEAMLEAITSPSPHPPLGYGGGRTWRPAHPGSATDARVLLVDNYDSFVWNLADYLGRLGARTAVRRNDEITVEAARRWQPTHVVLSPGPKGPSDTGVCPRLVKAFDGEVPVLGVCLGHQVIAHVHGASVEPAPEVVHGRSSAVRHDGASVLAGVPDGISGARYHSLHVPDPPPGFEPIARTDDGLLMGMAAADRPTVGLAFHPESVLTDHGPAILANFLGCSAEG